MKVGATNRKRYVHLGLFIHNAPKKRGRCDGSQRSEGEKFGICQTGGQRLSLSWRRKNEYVLSKQFLRSGTSIGANVTEAQYASSKKDFLNKMYIALKECAETLYWMELLFSCHYLEENEYVSLQKDCSELQKLLISITKSTKSTL